MWLSKSSKIRLEGTVAELRGRLREIKRTDRVAEKKAKQGCTTGGVGCLVAVLLMGRMMVGGDDYSPTVGWVYCMLAALGLCLAGWIYNSYYSKYDIDDDKQQMARSLLKVLSTDLKGDRRCVVALDFRDHGDKALQTSPPRFAQTWLELEGKLADGVRLSLSLTRRGRKAEKKKNKGTKVTVRFREVLALDMRVDPRRYPNLMAVRDELARAPFPGASQKVTLAGDRLRVKLTSAVACTSEYRNNKVRSLESLWTPARVSHGLVWLYHGLKKVKCQAVRG